MNNTNPATQNKGRTQDTKVKLGIRYRIKTNNTKIQHRKLKIWATLVPRGWTQVLVTGFVFDTHRVTHIVKSGKRLVGDRGKAKNLCKNE